MRRGNLKQNLPGKGAPESFDRLVQGKQVRVERIVSQGHASPVGFWYEQPEQEFVLLVEGRAELEFERQGAIVLEPGDWIEIRQGVRHRVVWTDPDQPTIWLAIFYE